LNPGALMAAQEGFSEEAERRKRLGQYFSGVGLARLLGALAKAESARSIIDPMAGNGDMLAGCLAIGARPKQMCAIEIDPIATTACAARLPEVDCILGSAFSQSVIAATPRREWELVITNPPYVRYQSLSRGAGRRFKLPGAMEVRNGLLKSLDDMSALDETDKRLFRAMVSGYSGLSDLAVPSWILCASMVSVGGRLALVVPESWLSRDYASVVHYLLLRWFQIEHIVEDEHAAWFEDAQVKTTLLVARRIKRRESAFGWDKRNTFIRTKVSGKAAGPEGPIARLFPGCRKPEALLSDKLAEVIDTETGIEDSFISVSQSPLARVAENLNSVCSKQKWFSSMGEKQTQMSVTFNPPEALSKWLGSDVGTPIITLESLGVSVGQGLRTGANGFFYATYLHDDGSAATVSVSGFDNGRHVQIPLECLHPVVRRQAELPEGFVIRRSKLKGRVLDFRTIALREDIKAGGSLARSAYSPMSPELSAFVRTMAAKDIGENGSAKRIPDLSAVAPNIRKGDAAKGFAPRFWYMLPDFAPRHQPDILMPRVNSGNPKAWLVADRGVLADANFSTLRVDGSWIDRYALLALLNSSWCRATLEFGASVMGGGALKVEATHLRRLPVPRLSESEMTRLSSLGKRLAKDGDYSNDIECLVASALLGRIATKREIAALSRLADDGLNRRKRQKMRTETR